MVVGMGDGRPRLGFPAAKGRRHARRLDGTGNDNTVMMNSAPESKRDLLNLWLTFH
jgi:hypothetical protein